MTALREWEVWTGTEVEMMDCPPQGGTCYKLCGFVGVRNVTAK